MGDTGVPRKTIILEPLPEEAPAELPVPAPVPVPDREAVPALSWCCRVRVLESHRDADGVLIITKTAPVDFGPVPEDHPRGFDAEGLFHCSVGPA